MLIPKKRLKLAQKILFLISLSFIFIQVNPHQIVLAKEVDIDFGKGPVALALINPFDHKNPTNPTLPAILENPSALPQNQDLPYYTTYITTTAYTSRPAETDDSPYIAAWGDHVFWGMVASNSFPKGTKIQIPEYFGDKVFSVLDRMNERYYYRLDVWMPTLDEARAWGTRYIQIKVYK